MSGEVLPGCIGMDDDDDGVLNGTTNLAGEFVCASYPFRQRNIFFLRNKDLDFVAAQAQVFCGGVYDDTVEFVLSEASVRRAHKTKCYNCFTFALHLRPLERPHLSLNVTSPPERARNRPIVGVFFLACSSSSPRWRSPDCSFSGIRPPS